MWIGWTRFDCEAGEDNILWNFVSLYKRSPELVDFFRILGRVFQVQWINGGPEINKTKLMQIITTPL